MYIGGTQQHVGMHSVAPRHVLPQPQHTAITGVPVHPQKTEGDSHKITTTSNTTTSTPVPSTAADSTKKQGTCMYKKLATYMCTEHKIKIQNSFGHVQKMSPCI